MSLICRHLLPLDVHERSAAHRRAHPRVVRVHGAARERRLFSGREHAGAVPAGDGERPALGARQRAAQHQRALPRARHRAPPLVHVEHARRLGVRPVRVVSPRLHSLAPAPERLCVELSPNSHLTLVPFPLALYSCIPVVLSDHRFGSLPSSFCILAYFVCHIRPAYFVARDL